MKEKKGKERKAVRKKYGVPSLLCRLHLHCLREAFLNIDYYLMVTTYVKIV